MRCTLSNWDDDQMSAARIPLRYRSDNVTLACFQRADAVRVKVLSGGTGYSLVLEET